jgi:DNA-binding transcriptional LysR family regulator
MDSRSIRFFIHLYEERSFTKAASRCFITEQGLSKAIQTLENELGVKLFTRNNRSVEPTVYGEALYKEAPAFLDGYKRIFDAVRAAGGANSPGSSVVQHVSLALMPGFSTFCNEKILNDFMASHRNILLDISTFSDDREQQSIVERGIEFGFIDSPVDNSALTVLRSKKSGLSLVVSKSHRLAEEKTVSLSALRGETLIGFNHSRHFAMLCEKYKLDGEISLDLSDMAFAKELCASGRAVFIMANPGEDYKDFAIIPLSGPDSLFEICFTANKKKALTPSGEIFADYIMQQGF